MSKQPNKKTAEKKTPKKHQTLKINLPFEEALKIAFSNPKFPNTKK
jgi:hypothetical protein